MLSKGVNILLGQPVYLAAMCSDPAYYTGISVLVYCTCKSSYNMLSHKDDISQQTALQCGYHGYTASKFQDS